MPNGYTDDEWRRLCLKAFENLPADTTVTMGDVDAILTRCLPETQPERPASMLNAAEIERLLHDCRFTSFRVAATIDGVGEVEMDFFTGRLSLGTVYNPPEVIAAMMPPVPYLPRDLVMRMELRIDPRMNAPQATIRQVRR